jgi:hypothetical protein
MYFYLFLTPIAIHLDHIYIYDLNKDPFIHYRLQYNYNGQPGFI